MPVLPSYRNHSIDLHSKSIDWLLYEGSTNILLIKVGSQDWRISSYLLVPFFIVKGLILEDYNALSSGITKKQLKIVAEQNLGTVILTSS